MPGPPRRLTSDQAVALREQAAAGTPGRVLAARYGISEQLVSGIVTGQRYQDVGGPIRATQTDDAPETETDQ